MTKLDEWLVRQVPPAFVWLLGILGWAGFLFLTPTRLKSLEAQQRQLQATVAARDSATSARVARVERVSYNLVRRACWESDEERRLWLECDQVLGNNLPGRRP